MPAGELYIKKTTAVNIANNDTAAKKALFNYSNGVFTQNDNGTWIDAYLRYGVSFTESSLSALTTPAPNKQPVENKNRTQHGKRVVRTTSLVKKDDRDINIEMHLKANSTSQFWSRYDLFCTEQLDYGFMEIINGHIPTKEFRLTYINCTQFSEFMEQIAKFILRMNEPNPMDRSI